MKICVPIQAKTQKEAKRLLKKAAVAGADLAEIWLDQIADLDIGDLLAKKPLPVVCVCKKPVEKGAFKGSYAQMAELLLGAAHAGADYVDVSLLNKKFVQQLRPQSSKAVHPRLIISHHDFKKTPSEAELMRKVKAMKDLGADVVKIATTANDFSDTVRIIILAKQLQTMGIPHILIAMGKKGMLSRVLTPTLGGEMMFAALDAKSTSAPGQLTIAQLKKYADQLSVASS